MHIHSMRDRATHATYVQVRRAHAAYMNTRHVPHMHTEDAPKAVISPQKNTKDGVPAEHVWEEHRGLSDPPHQRPAGHSILSMGFSSQEYWSGLLCLDPGCLPNPGTEPASLVSPALQVDSSLLRPNIHEAIVDKQASQVGAMVKNSPDNAGDTIHVSSIPGSGRCPREGNGTPLQYSCLRNSMDRRALQTIVYGVAKSWT